VSCEYGGDRGSGGKGKATRKVRRKMKREKKKRQGSFL
jgi:hypothetical protein